MRIGRVEGGGLSAARAAEVDAWAARESVSCLYLLLGADDVRSVHTAEDAGFRLMDVRVELAQRLDGANRPSELREARPEDHERLRDIARASHGTTRFYADPNFPDEGCDRLYETWIERSLEGWAAAVLVAERDGVPVGYCSCHLEDGSGSIGLIAVADSARRQGIGVELASGAVAWCAAQAAHTMSVVTQARNVAALSTFQRAGFIVGAVDLWLHKWYR